MELRQVHAIVALLVSARLLNRRLPHDVLILLAPPATVILGALLLDGARWGVLLQLLLQASDPGFARAEDKLAQIRRKLGAVTLAQNSHLLAVDDAACAAMWKPVPQPLEFPWREHTIVVNVGEYVHAARVFGEVSLVLRNLEVVICSIVAQQVEKDREHLLGHAVGRVDSAGRAHHI